MYSHNKPETVSCEELDNKGQRINYQQKINNYSEVKDLYTSGTLAGAIKSISGG